MCRRYCENGEEMIITVVPDVAGLDGKEFDYLVPDHLRDQVRVGSIVRVALQGRRTRAWVMTRRLTHTSHHRGQQTAMLRMLGRSLHSTYGPTADTGGLMQNRAPTIYAYSSLDALLAGEDRGGAKSPLPRAAGNAVTERPG